MPKKQLEEINNWILYELQDFDEKIPRKNLERVLKQMQTYFKTKYISDIAVEDTEVPTVDKIMELSLKTHNSFIKKIL